MCTSAPCPSPALDNLRPPAYTIRSNHTAPGEPQCPSPPPPPTPSRPSRAFAPRFVVVATSGCELPVWEMTGLELERLFISPPAFAPKLRPRLFVEGSRYERRVRKRLEQESCGAKFHLGPWLPGPCQPDAILEFSNSLIIIEIKLSACDVREQTAKYVRAVEGAGKRIWIVQIARNVSASFPPTITSLLDLRSPFEILHWWL